MDDHKADGFLFYRMSSNTQNKNLVEVGQMGMKNGSWLVNLLVTLGY